jgi:hypothetical protein
MCTGAVVAPDNATVSLPLSQTTVRVQMESSTREVKISLVYNT